MSIDTRISVGPCMAREMAVAQHSEALFHPETPQRVSLLLVMRDYVLQSKSSQHDVGETATFDEIQGQLTEIGSEYYIPEIRTPQQHNQV